MRALVLLVVVAFLAPPATASLSSGWEIFGWLKSKDKGQPLEEVEVTKQDRVKRQSGGVGDLSQEPHIVETSGLPMINNEVDTRMMPTLGNGMIGTTVYGKDIYLNGVYNGDSRTSHRARIPALVMTRVRLSAKTEETTNRKFFFNAATAIFTEEIDCNFATIWHHTYIHSKFPRLLVTDIYAERKSSLGGVIELSYPQLNQSEDFNWRPPEEKDFRWSVSGTTKQTEREGFPLATVHIYYHLPQTQIVLQGSNYRVNRTMVMAIDRTDAAARNEYDIANNIISETNCDINSAHQGPCGHYKLMKEHIDTWHKTWYSGRVEVSGDITVAKVAMFSQFYLLASLPAQHTPYPPQISDVFVGASRSSVSKGGSAVEDNCGHVFWDSEVYILPAVLPFHPWHAKQILKYRSQRFLEAQQYAEQLGEKGIRYPWQSAASGGPLFPDGCEECRQRRHHVNGGIAYGIRMFYSATRDRDFLTNPEWRGCDVTKGIAEFYANLAKYNTSKGRYDIHGVTGPDYSHPNVWNNAYTNVVASLAIHWARYMSCLCGRVSRQDIPDDWLQVALYLHLPYDTVRRVHHQHEGFDKENNQQIRQADTVMLGWPLNWNMSRDIWRNDLDYYVQLTNARTPAMTHSWHAVGWKFLGESNRADSSFRQSYDTYMKQPFKIWTEYNEGQGSTPEERAVNFLPGMGGFVQSLIYGYVGMRIRPEMLEFHNPIPPENCDTIKLIGLKYLEANLSVEIERGRVVLKMHSVGQFPLVLRRNSTYGQREEEEPLNPGAEVTITQPEVGFFIYSSQGTACDHPRDYIYMPWGYSPWINRATASQPKLFVLLLLLLFTVYCTQR